MGNNKTKFLTNDDMSKFIHFFRTIQSKPAFRKQLETKYDISTFTLDKLISLLHGLEGESVVRQLLKNSNIRYFQVDVVAGEDNFIIEIKHQEMFKKGSNCPFDGHGLPIWQVRDRVSFCKKHNLIPILIVVDLETDIIYYNSLLELEKGHKYITKKSKRVIYPIENFYKLNFIKNNATTPLRDIKGNIITCLD